MSKRIAFSLMAIGAILVVLGNGAVVSLSVIPQTLVGNQIICLPSANYGYSYTILCQGKVAGTVIAYNWNGYLLPAASALYLENQVFGTTLQSTCGLNTVYSSNLPTGTAPFGTNYGTIWSPNYNSNPTGFNTYIIGDTFYTDGCGNPTSSTSSIASFFLYSSTTTTVAGTTYALYITSTTSTVITTTTNTATSTATSTSTVYSASTVSTTVTSAVVLTSTSLSVIVMTTTVTVNSPVKYSLGGLSTMSFTLILIGLFTLGAGAVLYIGGGRRR